VPFSQACLVTDDAIRVLAVAHERRRPGYWHPRSDFDRRLIDGLAPMTASPAGPSGRANEWEVDTFRHGTGSG